MSDEQIAPTVEQQDTAWRETFPATAALLDMPNVKPLNSARVDVRVWFPETVPSARLQTVNVGTFHEPRETLPGGQPMANIKFCGIDIGGPLDLVEAQFAAAVEALVEVRKYADRLEAERDSGRQQAAGG